MDDAKRGLKGIVLKELSKIREDDEVDDGSQNEQAKISTRATPKNLIDQIFDKVNEFQVQSSQDKADLLTKLEIIEVKQI